MFNRRGVLKSAQRARPGDRRICLVQEGSKSNLETAARAADTLIEVNQVYALAALACDG